MLNVGWRPPGIMELRRRGERTIRRIKHEGLAFWGGYLAGEAAGFAEVVLERIRDGFDDAWSNWVEDPEPICRGSSNDGLDGPGAQAVAAMRRSSTSDTIGERKTLTPCCGKPIVPRGRPPAVMWNEWNGAVLCHHCGRLYVPAEDEDETAYDKWVQVGGGLLR